MSYNHSAVNPTTIGSSRDNQIDTIKFFLIFSIYIFHFQEAAGLFYPFINIYQVSIFFVVSGFWALSRMDKSPLQFVVDALKKYLVYWFVWVIIYAGYYTLENSYTFRQALSLFVRYFSGVRATGILGMWFTPAFFFVSFIYYLLAKGVSKVFKVSKQALAWICCSVFFLVYYVTKYYFTIPQNLIFSLGFVSEYLFYFSLGAAIYPYLCTYKRKVNESVFFKALNCLITLFSCAYFLLYLFKNENIIWGWIPDIFDGKLSLLSDIVTVLLMFFFISFIAKCVSCCFTAKIGQKTLGLCHCEAFTKGILVFLGNFVGLTVKAINPIEVLVFAFLALVFGCYVVLPVTDMVTKRILSVSGQ